VLLINIYVQIELLTQGLKVKRQIKTISRSYLVNFNEKTIGTPRRQIDIHIYILQETAHFAYKYFMI